MMPLLIKQIRPAKLEIPAFRQVIEAELRDVGKEIEADFKKTTKTWKHQPKFETVIETSPPTVLVGTDDEIYGYVDKGTKAHEIYAGIYTGRSNKKALAFPSKFTPKTKPGVIGSSPGGSGGKTVVRPYVMHPGTKPRKFEEAIKRQWEKKFKRRMEQAMSKAAKASGLGL